MKFKYSKNQDGTYSITCGLSCPYCGFTISGEPYQSAGRWYMRCPQCKKAARVSGNPPRASRLGPKRKYIRVLVVVPKDMWEDVKGIAGSRGISASEYVRRALAEQIYQSVSAHSGK